MLRRKSQVDPAIKFVYRAPPIFLSHSAGIFENTRGNTEATSSNRFSRRWPPRALVRGPSTALVPSPVGNCLRSSIDVVSLQAEIDDFKNPSRIRGLGKLDLPLVVDQAPILPTAKTAS